jgi:hypothetical protein
MRISGVLKGANQGVVYTYGLNPAHFQVHLLRRTSVTNHMTSLQMLSVRGIS